MCDCQPTIEIRKLQSLPSKDWPTLSSRYWNASIIDKTELIGMIPVFLILGFDDNETQETSPAQMRTELFSFFLEQNTIELYFGSLASLGRWCASTAVDSIEGWCNEYVDLSTTTQNMWTISVLALQTNQQQNQFLAGECSISSLHFKCMGVDRDFNRSTCVRLSSSLI